MAFVYSVTPAEMAQAVPANNQDMNGPEVVILPPGCAPPLMLDPNGSGALVGIADVDGNPAWMPPPYAAFVQSIPPNDDSSPDVPASFFQPMHQTVHSKFSSTSVPIGRGPSSHEAHQRNNKNPKCQHKCKKQNHEKHVCDKDKPILSPSQELFLRQMAEYDRQRAQLDRQLELLEREERRRQANFELEQAKLKQQEWTQWERDVERERRGKMLERDYQRKLHEIRQPHRMYNHLRPSHSKAKPLPTKHNVAPTVTIDTCQANGKSSKEEVNILVKCQCSACHKKVVVNSKKLAEPYTEEGVREHLGNILKDEDLNAEKFKNVLCNDCEQVAARQAMYEEEEARKYRQKKQIAALVGDILDDKEYVRIPDIPRANTARPLAPHRSHSHKHHHRPRPVQYACISDEPSTSSINTHYDDRAVATTLFARSANRTKMVPVTVTNNAYGTQITLQLPREPATKAPDITQKTSLINIYTPDEEESAQTISDHDNQQGTYQDTEIEIYESPSSDDESIISRHVHYHYHLGNHELGDRLDDGPTDQSLPDISPSVLEARASAATLKANYDYDKENIPVAQEHSRDDSSVTETIERCFCDECSTRQSCRPVNEYHARIRNLMNTYPGLDFNPDISYYHIHDDIADSNPYHHIPYSIPSYSLRSEINGKASYADVGVQGTHEDGDGKDTVPSISIDNITCPVNGMKMGVNFTFKPDETADVAPKAPATPTQGDKDVRPQAFKALIEEVEDEAFVNQRIPGAFPTSAYSILSPVPVKTPSRAANTLVEVDPFVLGAVPKSAERRGFTSKSRSKSKSKIKSYLTPSKKSAPGEPKKSFFSFGKGSS